MKRIALAALAAFLMLALPVSAAKPAHAAANQAKVRVAVAVPTTYSSTVTPAQGEAFVRAALGSPTDAPCIGSHTCSVNAWFKHELGQVFDYDVTIVPMTWGVTAEQGVDSCGSTAGPGWFYSPTQDLAAAGFGFTKNDRTMTLLMGGGGWAGHFAPTDRVPVHQGMVGDWGVMAWTGQPNACLTAYGMLPEDAFAGFSHEFAGMMGAYVTAGYNEGGLFVGDPMSANEKKDLVKYSGRWLRSP